jgi:hypothetical protein
MRILVVGERPAEDERQRGEADRRDVGTVIEAHRASRRGPRGASSCHSRFAAELQLFDRRSQHVLDDDQRARAA